MAAGAAAPQICRYCKMDHATLHRIGGGISGQDEVCLRARLVKAERVVTFARFLQAKEMSVSDLRDAEMKLAKAVEEYDGN